MKRLRFAAVTTASGTMRTISFLFAVTWSIMSIGCSEAHADTSGSEQPVAALEPCRSTDAFHPVRFAEHLYPDARAADLARLVVTVTRPTTPGGVNGYSIKQTLAWVRDGSALVECGDDGTSALFQLQ